MKGTDSQTSHVGLLAASYLISGEKDRGLKYLRGLVKKKYDCVHYLKDLSQSLIAAGNLARAKSLLTAAIEIKFYDQETSALLAQCESVHGVTDGHKIDCRKSSRITRSFVQGWTDARRASLMNGNRASCACRSRQGNGKCMRIRNPVTGLHDSGLSFFTIVPAGRQRDSG